MTIFFWLLALIIIAAGLGAVIVRNIMHSALLLGLALLGVAGVFLLLGADFLAAVQVTVYVSGVLILMLFVVMLTHRLYDRTLAQTNERVMPALILGLVILVLLVAAITGADLDRQMVDPETTVFRLGTLLLTVYLVPFEVASVLLLAAMIGAILFTMRDPGQEDKS